MIEELACLAKGPMKGVSSYEGNVINGFRFQTRRRQRKRKTQNSGIIVEGKTENGKKDFYGVLEEVIVLEYNPLKVRQVPKLWCSSANGLMCIMKGEG